MASWASTVNAGCATAKCIAVGETHQCADATATCAVLGACWYIAAQNEARERKQAAFREEREAQARSFGSPAYLAGRSSLSMMTGDAIHECACTA